MGQVIPSCLVYRFLSASTALGEAWQESFFINGNSLESPFSPESPLSHRITVRVVVLESLSMMKSLLSFQNN